MPSPFPLPDDPDLEQLRQQAKDLRDLARAGVEGALELVGAHHPDGPHRVTLARTLLDLGADPARRDTRFHATPLEWARHFAQRPTVELLESVDPSVAGRRR